MKIASELSANEVLAVIPPGLPTRLQKKKKVWKYVRNEECNNGNSVWRGKEGVFGKSQHNAAGNSVNVIRTRPLRDALT